MRAKKFRDPEYLDHIADRIARIERATSHADLADFRSNQDLQAAIERYVEVIGEAAGKLSQQTRDLAPDVPWSQLIGARNVIVHGYAEIEPDRIWDIVKSHVPSLRVAVERLRRLLNEQERENSQQHVQSEETPDPSEYRRR
ncbi:MAG: DUF86 domain-containing protein [Gallionella sp.]|nr:DUF86 domain-containing protein [Gallionella sp.]